MKENTIKPDELELELVETETTEEEQARLQAESIQIAEILHQHAERLKRIEPKLDLILSNIKARKAKVS